MNGILERIKKFLYRTKNQNKTLEQSSITEKSPTPSEPQPPKSDNAQTVFQTENSLSSRPPFNFEKMARYDKQTLRSRETLWDTA